MIRELVGLSHTNSTDVPHKTVCSIPKDDGGRQEEPECDPGIGLYVGHVCY